MRGGPEASVLEVACEGRGGVTAHCMGGVLRGGILRPWQIASLVAMVRPLD